MLIPLSRTTREGVSLSPLPWRHIVLLRMETMLRHRIAENTCILRTVKALEATISTTTVILNTQLAHRDTLLHLLSGFGRVSLHSDNNEQGKVGISKTSYYADVDFLEQQLQHSAQTPGYSIATPLFLVMTAIHSSRAPHPDPKYPTMHR